MKASREPGCFPAEQTAFPGPYHPPSALALGEWHVLANGRIYTLNVTAVTGGRVTARLSSGEIERAAWDATTRRLTFIRVLRELRQEFTGYLLHYDSADPKWRMAGVFGDVEVGPQSGWYATLPRS